LVILGITLIFSFFVTYFATPTFIKFFKEIGTESNDVHKQKKTLIPMGGGICAISGVLSGIFLYIALNTFILKNSTGFIELFSAVASILLITISGFFDDLASKQVKYEGFTYKKGLKQWQKPLLTLPAVIPLMVINAGVTSMSIPIFGVIDFGLIYPLLIVPIGIIGCANMVNLLGGFNGLEATLGVIYTLSLGLFSFYIGETISGVILLSTTASLLAFLIFNYYPAKVFPGDSLTYLLGGIVAVCAILANMEKFALMTMSLFLLEGLLKARSLIDLKKFASSLGIYDKNTGLIKPKYNKIYSLTHLAMGKNGSTEQQVVIKLAILQTIIALIPWILYK